MSLSLPFLKVLFFPWLLWALGTLLGGFRPREVLVSYDSEESRASTLIGSLVVPDGLEVESIDAMDGDVRIQFRRTRQSGEPASDQDLWVELGLSPCEPDSTMQIFFWVATFLRAVLPPLASRPLQWIRMMRMLLPGYRVDLPDLTVDLALSKLRRVRIGGLTGYEMDFTPIYSGAKWVHYHLEGRTAGRTRAYTLSFFGFDRDSARRIAASFRPNSQGQPTSARDG